MQEDNSELEGKVEAGADDRESSPLFQKRAEAASDLEGQDLLPEKDTEERSAADFVLKEFGIENPEDLSKFPFGDREKILEQIEDSELREEVEDRLKALQPEEARAESEEGDKEAQEKEQEKEKRSSEELQRIAEAIAERNLNIAESTLKNHVTGFIVEYVTGNKEYAQDVEELTRMIETPIIKGMLRALCIVDSAMAARNQEEFGKISSEALRLFDEGWDEKGSEIEKDLGDAIERASRGGEMRRSSKAEVTAK